MNNLISNFKNNTNFIFNMQNIIIFINNIYNSNNIY